MYVFDWIQFSPSSATFFMMINDFGLWVSEKLLGSNGHQRRGCGNIYILSSRMETESDFFY